MRTRFHDWPCSVARTLELVEPWSALVLREIFYGVRRFDALQANLGLARNVLAQRLARLVEEGVLARVEYQQRPVRCEYRLTDKGRALFDVVLALMRFGDEWLAPEGEPVLLMSRRTGERVRPVVVDEQTRERIDLRDVIAKPGPGMPPEVIERAGDRFRKD
jgi:DNA-binding HxlR family transcriptional regulator